MTAPSQLIIDHLDGTNRGMRQSIAIADGLRVRFGRHPDSDVCFDANRDRDASSRHAELRIEAGAFCLVDVGSANGTFVDGKRIVVVGLDEGQSVVVEFGAGGPIVRLFIGNVENCPPLPAGSRFFPVRWPPMVAMSVMISIVVILAAAITAWILLVKH